MATPVLLRSHTVVLVVVPSNASTVTLPEGTTGQETVQACLNSVPVPARGGAYATLRWAGGEEFSFGTSMGDGPPRRPATLWTATTATVHGKLLYPAASSTLSPSRATDATTFTWVDAYLPPQTLPVLLPPSVTRMRDYAVLSSPRLPPLELYRANLPGQAST